MPPPPNTSRCEQHDRDIAEIKDRLKKGGEIFDVIRRIERAVCGDEAMGIEGLAALPKRVKALEFRYWWTLGAIAAASAALQLYQTFKT